MSIKIYAPNVHLFAFHLKDSKQPNVLWEKCNYLLSKKIGVTKPLEIKEENQGYRVDLLKDRTDDDASFHFESTVSQNGTPLPIAGFATPLRIHDTYVLNLNLRRPEFDENDKKTNPVELNFLKLLNPSGCLMPSKNENEIDGSLGQTILLTVWYTPEKQSLPGKSPENRQQLRELANDCVREFIPNNYPFPGFNKEGQLFGSPIFEYGVPNQNNNYCHILVWVYCESETSEILVNYYNKFVDLFYDLNKTIAAYHRSRKVYQVTRKDYQEIKTYLDNLFQKIPVDKNLDEAELQEFKHYLKDIPKKYLLYSQLIQELEQCRLTIEINAQNYRREIRDIQSQLPSEDISFLRKFADEDCHLFIEQIQADLGYLQDGAALLENAMTAIQGRVEIEQAERDRSLENTVQVLGIAFGGGAIVSGVVTQNINKPFIFELSDVKYSISPLALSLFWSLVATIIFWMVACLIFKPKRKKNKQK